MEYNEGCSSPSYYAILGVSTDSSGEEIRRAYRKLAMEWHPDKWATTPSLLGEANRRFQEIQEAYSVLSDRSKRTMYDAGLYNPDEEEGFANFLQEMMSLMADARREDKNYSMEELQSMFWEMSQSFQFPEWSDPPKQQPVYESSQWFCGQFTLNDSRTTERPWWDRNPVLEKGSQDKNNSMEELQNMLCEMTQNFQFPEWFDAPKQPLYESPQWFCGQCTLDNSRNLKRDR